MKQKKQTTMKEKKQTTMKKKIKMKKKNSKKAILFESRNFE